MKSLNLFALTRVNDVGTFYNFEKQLSGREIPLKAKAYEMQCIIEFVNSLRNVGALIENFDGFYHSYVIQQIGKEFDLLRIGYSGIINIELKSQQVAEEKIQSQLINNKYYLSHLGRPLSLFTFISSNKKIYCLDENDTIKEDTLNNLYCTLQSQYDLFNGDINSLFRVSDFLVSPLNTPERFLNKNYFLTSQQENYKKLFFEELETINSHRFVGITGGPGTGKTLLVYDLAMQCSAIGKCCLIHCGILSAGHYQLNQKLDQIDIIEAKSVNNFDFSSYNYIFVDESHRIYEKQFQIIVENTISSNITAVFSFDSRQTLSQKERRADIAVQIQGLSNYTEYKLSNKVRTNKELASFIRKLMNLNATDVLQSYSSISIMFANDSEEALILIGQFKKNGYVFINYTKSNYYASRFDYYRGDYNTHRVIGQEFDNVVMVMDSSFSYDQNGRLQGCEHPNPDYLYRQLLFQGLTRVREKLALVIIEDFFLFQKILSILQ